MRIIGGSARGRRLAAFAGRTIRPTPDRVREALFSILYSRRGPFSGARVLDLFAGSGALGIEALSRGAVQACFVDSSPQAVATVRQNLELCGFTGKATVIMRDVWSVLQEVAGSGGFDIVFADPPYGHDHAPRLLAQSAAVGLLAAGGILCIETAGDDRVPATAGNLRMIDQRRYGSTTIHVYQSCDEEPREP